ncbi:ArsR/SmtB family transcription factor [Castellaniella sp.]|uniref:ArsR/SmtB family transcription factor n=1 Tax=Castellaniella sp. TaxID=1955812 RepID=UPI00355EC389
MNPADPSIAKGPSGGPKQAVLAHLAGMAHAVAHPHRLELLERLAQAPRSVEELAGLCELSFANTSRHLQILRRARLVVAERQGKHVLYSLDNARQVVALLQALGTLAERNRAEVRQIMHDYYTDRGQLAPVTQQELLARLRSGSVTLLDVRPAHEYASGHLPGAVNIPLRALGDELSGLPRDQQIVAYCRGPYCVLAVEAVALLRARGFKAQRLAIGYPEWQLAGLAVDTGVATGRGRPTAPDGSQATPSRS